MSDQEQGASKLTAKQKAKVGIGRTLLWQSRAVSLSCNLLLIGFISIYCTDTLKIDAILVGILLMASKIFDGVTDVIAGYIVDKTNTKWGRGRPYEWNIVFVWVCTFLMFSCPTEWTMYTQCAWVFANYVLVNSVFSTFLNASNTVYMVRAFKYQEQYVALSSYGAIIVMLGAVIVNVTFPMLVENFAVDAAGWQFIVALFAIPLALIGMLRFFTIKETNDVDVSADKVHIKDVLLVLRKNPYIYIISALMLVYNLVTNMGVNMYYFTYIVGNVGVMGIIAFAQIIAMPLVIIFPAFIRKFSVRTLMIVGLAVSGVGYVLNFFAFDNIALLMAGSVLVGAGAIPISMLAGLLIIECADYNEWIKLPRLEGTLGSVNGFATKVGVGLGAGFLGIMLSVSGYTGAMETMPDSALGMIRFLYTLLPAILYVILIFLMRFYKLTDKIEAIRADNEANRVKLQEQQAVQSAGS